MDYSLSLYRCTLEHIKSSVLILILMDYSLSVYTIGYIDNVEVLILILMDYSLSMKKVVLMTISMMS